MSQTLELLEPRFSFEIVAGFRFALKDLRFVFCSSFGIRALSMDTDRTPPMELRFQSLQELRQEIVQELRTEIVQELRKEIRQELRKEIMQELPQLLGKIIEEEKKKEIDRHCIMDKRRDSSTNSSQHSEPHMDQKSVKRVCRDRIYSSQDSESSSPYKDSESSSKYRARMPNLFNSIHARRVKHAEGWVVPLRSFEDIQEKFVKFCLGELRSSPWSEKSLFQPNSKNMREQLQRINKKGFLTFSSQAAVNGEMSDSPCVGWGEPGGYIYQKGFVKFFCSKQKLDAFLDKCNAFPFLAYIAMNRKGARLSCNGMDKTESRIECISNMGKTEVNVLKWGVFPEKNIVQRKFLRLDTSHFDMIDSFHIWSMGWANLFPEGDPSRKLLEEVQENYFLVCLVDDDYIHGDLFAILDQVLT